MVKIGIATFFAITNMLFQTKKEKKQKKKEP